MGIHTTAASAIYVPVNAAGFFKGPVLQAERVFVDLGRQYVAECSADQAEAILTRSRHFPGLPSRS